MIAGYAIKMLKYGDYNSTPILYLLSNLGSNFYVQTYVDQDNNKDNSVMINLGILLKITNAFLPILPLTYAERDSKNIIMFIM
jgi:hypothetical protein